MPSARPLHGWKAVLTDPERKGTTVAAVGVAARAEDVAKPDADRLWAAVPQPITREHKVACRVRGGGQIRTGHLLAHPLPSPERRHDA